jgi:hypothetical protein
LSNPTLLKFSNNFAIKSANCVSDEAGSNEAGSDETGSNEAGSDETGSNISGLKVL